MLDLSKYDNITKAFTLNVLTSGYDMEEGSKPLAIWYAAQRDKRGF
jgi:hypothetical protein